MAWNIFFPYIRNNHPNWRTHIFQRGRYTTNQLYYTINININVNHHVSSFNGHESWPFALLPLSGAGNESIFGGAGRPWRRRWGDGREAIFIVFFQDSYHGIDDYSPYTSIHIHIQCFDHGTYEDSWKVSLENSWIFLDMIDPILWPHLDETAGKMQQNTALSAFKQSPLSCASYERWQDSKNLVSSISSILTSHCSFNWQWRKLMCILLLSAPESQLRHRFYACYFQGFARERCILPCKKQIHRMIWMKNNDWITVFHPYHCICITDEQLCASEFPKNVSES